MEPPAHNLTSSNGGSRSALLLEDDDEWAQAGILEMPWRCSHEKGTAKAHDGKAHRWREAGRDLRDGVDMVMLTGRRTTMSWGDPGALAAGGTPGVSSLGVDEGDSGRGKLFSTGD